MRVVFFHTSFLLSVPLEEEKELKRQRVKEGRNTEELGEGTKVRRQCVWELSIYNQPPNDARLRRGNCESKPPFPVVIGPLSQ